MGDITNLYKTLRVNIRKTKCTLGTFVLQYHFYPWLTACNNLRETDLLAIIDLPKMLKCFGFQTYDLHAARKEKHE
jgi:hypothetical protein